jgi:hypothetical protein
MILRTHKIPENFSNKMFSDVGDMLDFSYMPNFGKCLQRNHFQGKCFPPKIFFDESQAGPGWVPVGSRAGLR